MHCSQSRILRLLRKLFGWGKESSAGFDGVPADDFKLTLAIHDRENKGMETMLGQLHQITSLRQSEALRAAARLENAGVLEIHSNIGDAFKSPVSLSQTTRRRLAREYPAKSPKPVQ